MAVGATAGRGGGSDILSKRACCAVCTSAMSCLTCTRPLASSARFCRTAARPDNIGSSCCSRFEDDPAGARTACGLDAIGLLEDCQTKAAATPMQNVNGSTTTSNIRLSSNSLLIENHSFFWSPETFWSAETRLASTDGLVAPAENRDRAELSVELIGAFHLVTGLPKHLHHSGTRATPESCGQNWA